MAAPRAPRACPYCQSANVGYVDTMWAFKCFSCQRLFRGTTKHGRRPKRSGPRKL